MTKEDLREYIEKIPPRIKVGGSIQEVRQYRRDHAKALKVFNKLRPNDPELTQAINLMKSWFNK